ncbi:MAG: hypothetical protein GXN93_04740 [Candidatus Diapherotrites archaeon]|nr:hypothetical protein [Candidatus Diapherotrites archaeon]
MTAVKVTITISDPVLQDAERLRKERGYDNRSAWLEYLITRGLEVVRREAVVGEGHGNSTVAVATA